MYNMHLYATTVVKWYTLRKHTRTAASVKKKFQ